MKCKYKDICVNENTVVTIGNFDGVHVGHRKLIERAKEVAAGYGLKSAVLTFMPHPRVYFNDMDFKLIMTQQEKESVINKMAVDYCVFADFNRELSSLNPAQFVQSILIDRMNCRHVVVGENYFFGRGKSGDANSLRALCYERNIGIDVLPVVKINGERVSSERIRAFLLDGEPEKANEFLGAPFLISGKVVHGNSLGRTLGFPTINLEISDDKLLPKFGVYFSEVCIEDKKFNGITNIGIRPTVCGAVRSSETHIFNFDQDVYGLTADISLLRRHRDEMRFESLDMLKENVWKDKQKAVEFFENNTCGNKRKIYSY